MTTTERPTAQTEVEPLNLDVVEWTEDYLYRQVDKTSEAVDNSVGERQEQLKRLLNHYCFEVHCRITYP